MEPIPNPESTAVEPPEIEPISADQARAILQQAIRERLGDNWDDPDNGWTKVTGHDYMARLTKGKVNVDFYVDLLGNVTVEKSELNPAQDSAMLVAGMVLLVSILLAFMIARGLGWG
jgi:hypothetical protein